MPDPAWLSLLLQIPVVGIFVWFVLTLLDRHQKSEANNHEEWRAWLEQRDVAFLATIQKAHKDMVESEQRLFTTMDTRHKDYVNLLERTLTGLESASGAMKALDIRLQSDAKALDLAARIEALEKRRPNDRP